MQRVVSTSMYARARPSHARAHPLFACLVESLTPLVECACRMTTKTGSNDRETGEQLRSLMNMFNYHWMETHGIDDPPRGCCGSPMELYLMLQQVHGSMVPSFNPRRNIWEDYEEETGQRLLTMQNLLDLQRHLRVMVMQATTPSETQRARGLPCGSA